VAAPAAAPTAVAASQPAGGNHRTQTGNSKQTKAREQTSRATKASADADTFSATFRDHRCRPRHSVPLSLQIAIMIAVLPGIPT
jgi:hypothetical protein